MPNSEYRPDLMGNATLEPSGAIEAGSMQSSALVYTCRPFRHRRHRLDRDRDSASPPISGPSSSAIRRAGRLHDRRSVERRHPRSSNGNSSATSGPGAARFISAIVKDFLAPGDTVTIRFGDRRHGSPGIRYRPIARASSNFTCSPTPSRPTTTSPCPKARKSLSSLAP